MVSTVRQVVDAVYRDWLRSPDDYPVVTRLTGAVTHAATSLTIDTSMLQPEELDLFAGGTIVEVDQEQMVLRAYATGTLTVIRGVNGTTAKSHAENAAVYPQPKYPRRAVYEAVCDAVPSLWPDLYQVAARDVTIGTAYTAMPSWAHMILEVMWSYGGTWYTDSGTLARNFSASPTRAALFSTVPAGRTATVRFRGGFPRPESESDDLEILGVRREWERIVAAEAAAQVIAGSPEADPLTHEFVAEQMARETMPPGGAGQIAQQILKLAAGWREQGMRQLRAEYHHPVAFSPGSGV